MRHLKSLLVLDPVVMTALHAFSHRRYVKGARLVPWLIFRLSGILWGAEVHPGATLSRPVHFAHTQGVVIGRGVTAGPGLKVMANVTVGDIDGKEGSPCLGANVVVGAGACILGRVTVGHDVVIGANAVVIR